MDANRTQMNGNIMKEPELISPKTLAEMWGMKVRTIREWVNIARNKPGPNNIPFIQIPGSRLIRFRLKDVREWYARGNQL